MNHEPPQQPWEMNQEAREMDERLHREWQTEVAQKTEGNRKMHHRIGTVGKLAASAVLLLSLGSCGQGCRNSINNPYFENANAVRNDIRVLNSAEIDLKYLSLNLERVDSNGFATDLTHLEALTKGVQAHTKELDNSSAIKADRAYAAEHIYPQNRRGLLGLFVGLPLIGLATYFARRINIALERAKVGYSPSKDEFGWLHSDIDRHYEAYARWKAERGITDKRGGQ